MSLPPLFGVSLSCPALKPGFCGISLPRFGAGTKTKKEEENPIIGGKLRKLDIELAQNPWREQVTTALNQHKRKQSHHPVVQKILESFGLGDWVGFPPTLFLAPLVEGRGSTNGALAAITLDALRQLPAASTDLEAVGQIYETVDQVDKTGRRSYRRFIETRDPNYETEPGGFGAFGYPVAGINGRIYSTVQTSHLVFVGKNGAIKMLRLPDAQTLAGIIRHDPAAQKFIDAKRPLSHPNHDYLPPLLVSHNGDIHPSRSKNKTHQHIKEQQGLGVEGTLRFLEEKATGHWQNRLYYSWTDIHTLIDTVPINWEKHIRAGRAQVMFEKPGADGQQVQIPVPRRSLTLAA